jgi:hypothetical protein
MTEPDPNNPAQQRIWNDSAEGATISEADAVAHSPEGIKILLEQGADAYHKWLAEQGQ